MNYWLMKSEPDEFSIDDLLTRPAQTEPWQGIRNYQARNFLRDAMQIGDQAFFYHSSCKVPAIVGIVEITSDASPDHSAFNPESPYFDIKSHPDNPRWVQRDIKFVEKFNDIISLTQLKSLPYLSDMYLVSKGTRLSIQPVTKQQWDAILSLISKS